MFRKIMTAAALALAPAAGVVAVAIPHALAAQQRIEDRNTRIVRSFYEDALAKGDAAKGAAMLTEDFVQHGADMGSGRAGFLDWAKKRDLAKTPLKLEVLHTIAQGDKVAVFLRSDRPGEGEIGYMDFYRVTPDGRLAERWAFTEKAPDPKTLLHTNGFITVPRPTDRSKIGKAEARNLQGALGWFYDVLGKGDIEHSSMVQQTDYIQHARGVATGNAGFREWAARRNLPQNPFKIITLMTVSEGDYIVCLGVGDIGGRLVAMPDWIRMKDGKLQEHWGLVQLVPAEADMPHRNGLVGGLKAVR
jgi:predicted SnoaL-like aldol condensation-catalyzing enzyme